MPEIIFKGAIKSNLGVSKILIPGNTLSAILKNLSARFGESFRKNFFEKGEVKSHEFGSANFMLCPINT